MIARCVKARVGNQALAEPGELRTYHSVADAKTRRDPRRLNIWVNQVEDYMRDLRNT